MDDAIESKPGLKLSDWQVIVTAAGLAVVAILIAGIYAWSQSNNEDTARVVTGVQFPYPTGWSEQQLTEADRNAGLMLQLDKQAPEASFLARTVIARTPADLDLSGLAAATEEALAAEVDGFQLVSSELVEYGERRVVEVTYQQAGNDPGETHRIRMTILPSENQTFYLTFRAAAGDFDAVADDGQQIVEDFVTYVSASEQ